MKHAALASVAPVARRRPGRRSRCRSPAVRPPSRPPTTPAATRSSATAPLTTATPVYVEIYEPTIPIPATPQVELQFGYTKVVADSSSSRGRASLPVARRRGR